MSPLDAELSKKWELQEPWESEKAMKMNDEADHNPGGPEGRFRQAYGKEQELWNRRTGIEMEIEMEYERAVKAGPWC